MKQIITRDEVAKAINDLSGQGRKPTLTAIHAALNNRGSMSTLMRLKAEIESAGQPTAGSPEAVSAFQEIWATAVKEGRKQQEALVLELRDNLKTLATENERLDGSLTAAQDRANQFEQAKSRAEAELNQTQARLECQVNQAQTALVEATKQAADALQKLTAVQDAHAAEFSSMHADLASAVSRAHGLELELARTQALLEAKGVRPAKA